MNLFVAELELGMCVFGVAHPWAAEESSTIHGPQTHIPSSTQQKGFLKRFALSDRGYFLRERVLQGCNTRALRDEFTASRAKTYARAD